MAEKHKRFANHGGLFFRLIRLILSLFILGIFLFGVYLAIKSFSGIDPLHIDSQQSIRNLLISDKTYHLLKSILPVDSKISLLESKSKLTTSSSSTQGNEDFNQKVKIFSFAVVTDSHNDNQNLFEALLQAKKRGAVFVIGLGDYTDVGTIAELQEAKKQFDKVQLPYYLIPGDHDLWDARNQGLSPIQNFLQVFGSPYIAFTYQNIRFILIYNSDIYFGIDQVQQKWIDEELERIKKENLSSFVFLSTPLYHPSSDHVMGRVTPKLKDQAEQLIEKFGQVGVKEIFAGDVHFYSRYQEPKTGVKMTIVGALTSTRNLQSPRYILVDVYENGGYNIQDLQLK